MTCPVYNFGNFAFCFDSTYYTEVEPLSPTIVNTPVDECRETPTVGTTPGSSDRNGTRGTYDAPSVRRLRTACTRCKKRKARCVLSTPETCKRCKELEVPCDMQSRRGITQDLAKDKEGDNLKR